MIEEKVETLDEKKKSKKGLVFTIFLILVIIGLVGYIAYDKGIIDLGQKKEVQEKEETKQSKTQESNTNQLLKFDTSKVVNNDSAYYNLRAQDGISGVDFSFENKKKLSVSVTWNIIKENMLLGQNKKQDEISNYEIEFDKEVEDIFVGGIGHDSRSTLVLFIMEDGTVEYIHIYEAIEKEEFKSYGKVEGLENIVKLYSAGAHPKDSYIGGIMTVLAQQSDGKLYDLEKLIKFN